jgi:hypothetical protein
VLSDGQAAFLTPFSLCACHWLRRFAKVRLYSEQVSNFTARCRIVIGEKGLHEIEIVSPPLEYLNSSEFLKINQLGKLPALEIDGSTSLFEPEVINEYLEERFPQTPLMPPDPLARARARLICRFPRPLPGAAVARTGPDSEHCVG